MATKRPEPAITEYNESQNLFDRNRQALENNKHLNFVRRILSQFYGKLLFE